MGSCEVEPCLWVLGFEVPEADGVVEGAGDEFVFAGVYGEGGDWGCVAREIGEEFGFVGVEVADAVVGFGGREDDVGLMVGEAREVGAVLLRWDCFYVFAFFGVVELEGVVGASCDEQFAPVVETEGSDGDVRLGELEALSEALCQRRVVIGFDTSYLYRPHGSNNV